MSRRAVTCLICAILAFGAVNARSVLFAQVEKETAPAGNDPRWQSLTEEQRKEFRRRFEHFKKLPPEKQKELVRRHEELRRLREKIAEKVEAELKDLSPEERKRTIDRRVRRELENIRKRIKKKEFHRKVPPGDERWGPARRMRKGIERETIRLAERRLSQMVDEGLITPEERRRILELPHEEKVAWILDRQKKDALRFLEGNSSPEEIERFRRMSRHRFHDEMRRQRKERGLFGGFARLCKLTPEQSAALKEIADKGEREARMRAFFDENFRRRLESLGIEKAAIDDILALPMPLRIRKLACRLREIPPEKIPPDLRPLLAPPPHPEQRRPRRPGRPDGPGPGMHGRGDRGPPGEHRPGERRSGERRSGERRSGEYRPGERRPGGREPGRSGSGRGDHRKTQDSEKEKKSKPSAQRFSFFSPRDAFFL